MNTIPFDDDFCGVILSAVRYCLGRRTYMPHLVTDWIMRNCHHQLDAGTIDVLKRDIDECPFCLGDTCDIEQWKKFRSWLDNEKPWHDAVSSRKG